MGGGVDRFGFEGSGNRDSLAFLSIVIWGEIPVVRRINKIENPWSKPQKTSRSKQLDQLQAL